MTMYPFVRRLSDLDAPVLPVTVEEAKSFMRISHDRLDVEISHSIRTAAQSLRTAIGRDLLSTGWRLMLDHFPRGATPIRINLGPILTVEQVTYIDPDGEHKTLLPDVDFTAIGLNDLDGATLFPKLGKTWPVFIQHYTTIGVDFYSGFGTVPAEVPEPLRTAILYHVAHQYMNMGDAAFSNEEYNAIVRNYKVWVA